MDAVKFLMENERMCERYKVCSRCPLYDNCMSSIVNLGDAIKTVEIVEKWSEEHPVKTNGMVIMETLARMDVPCVGTVMNELEQKVEISIDAEWWDAEYKEGSNE